MPGFRSSGMENAAAAGAVSLALWLDDAMPFDAGERAGYVCVRDLLATLDLGIAMARDPDGTIRHWSMGCQVLYGWSQQEAIGQISHRLLQTVFPVPLAEIEAQLLSTNEWTGDLRHRTKDGRELIVVARKALRRAPSGTPVAVLESIADVTAQREAEARFAASLKQLGQAAKMEALGRLAGGIAHDFNNVLQLLQASLEVAGQPGREDGQRLIALAASVGQRGSRITSRLLAFARQTELRAEAVEAGVLLHRVIDLLQPAIGPSIALHSEVGVALPALMADEGQLETVLINLANSARDAMPRSGTLTLGASAEVVGPTCSGAAGLAPGRYIRLTVTDTGEGMSPEVLAQVTEPFFTTKRKGKGTGLGLSMAFGFAEQSGGRLSIASVVGRGTTVSLWLPQASVEATHGPAEGRTVLLVDDEADLRSIFAEFLADQNFKVVTAESAEAALAVLDAGTVPDIIVTDYAMPGTRNGCDLIGLVRRRHPGIPAIMMTGNITALELERVLGDTVVIIRKPFSTSVLLEQIRQRVASS